MSAESDMLRRKYEEGIAREHGVRVMEVSAPLTRDQLFHEITLQMLLMDGTLGREFMDGDGRHISIREIGTWNRGAGPDFLGAHLCIDGKKVQGDIELDIAPEDWEKHGHGSNPNFDHVVLHVVCLPAAGKWFTRNSRHELIPHVCLDAETLRHVVLLPPVLKADQSPGRCALLTLKMTDEQKSQLLLSASAYRLHKKYVQFQRVRDAFGDSQALYEAMATTLGYSKNKTTMLQLARRAPLKTVKAHPEAILFGTAQFLVPVLPEKCTPETRKYHKNLWDYWWRHRESFELSEQRSIVWNMHGVRPVNHPQRRLAALASVVQHWGTFELLCSISTYKELIAFLTSLKHPYWSTHFRLPSLPFSDTVALIGMERAREFIINHLCAMDETEESWSFFSKLTMGPPNSDTMRSFFRIFGNHADTKWLRYAYQHQGLLQIQQDYCAYYTCDECPLYNKL